MPKCPKEKFNNLLPLLYLLYSLLATKITDEGTPVFPLALYYSPFEMSDGQNIYLPETFWVIVEFKLHDRTILKKYRTKEYLDFDILVWNTKTLWNEHFQKSYSSCKANFILMETPPKGKPSIFLWFYKTQRFVVPKFSRVLSFVKNGSYADFSNYTPLPYHSNYAVSP